MICDFCGKDYPCIPSIAKRRNKHYCSRPCYLAAHQPQLKKCEKCNKPCRNRFCSRKCYWLAGGPWQEKQVNEILVLPAEWIPNMNGRNGLYV